MNSSRFDTVVSSANSCSSAAAEPDPAAVPLPLEVELGRPRLADEYLHLLGPEPGVRECPLHGLDVDPGREVAGDRVGRLVNVSLVVRVGIDL